VTKSDFGVEIAQRLNRDLGVDVRFLHEEDVIVLSESAERQVRLGMASFRLMFEEGHSLDDIAGRLTRIVNLGRQEAKMTWSDIQASVVPHVTEQTQPYLVGVDPMSPLLRTVAAVDTEESVLFLTTERLRQLGVSAQQVQDVARDNIARILREHPGTVEMSPDGSHTVMLFEGDLAADRAWAYARELHRVAVAFLSPDVALAHDNPSLEDATMLAIMARCLQSERRLLHAFTPAVHVFEHGVLTGLGGAIPVPSKAPEE